MKRALLMALFAGAITAGNLQAQDAPHIIAAPANDPRAYQPQVAPRPLPAESTQVVPTGPAMREPLPSEEAFVRAYLAHRSPRVMVFVNRTINGDSLQPDGLAELTRTEVKQSATGSVNVANEHVSTAQNSAAAAAAGWGGASASAGAGSTNDTSKTGFSSNGPAEYTKTTSVKVAPDKYDEVGATKDDYEMIELSIVNYMDAGGRVQIKDADAARNKLDREKILRLENGDAAAWRLLSTELQTDILIQVKAVPTRQASSGAAIRLMCKAVSTTDARNLGTAVVDMPLPISKTNVNVFTRHLAEKMMQQMAEKWSGNPEWDPIEVRIYKAAAVDDTITIRKFLQRVKGVESVKTLSATGGSHSAYAALAVAYTGAPEDLYSDLKEALSDSTGLKAVDLQNNTINVEVTGPMNLVTTTKKTETKVTTETTSTEVKTIVPVRPAATQPGN